MKNKQELSIQLKELSRLRGKLSKRVKKLHKVWFDLESQSSAIKAGRCDLIAELTPVHRQAFPAPVFHGRQPCDPAPHMESREWDPVKVTLHRHVQVLGGCNFLLYDKVAVHPDLYRADRDRSPIELYGKARMAADFKRIRIPLGLSVGRLPHAINLCDQTPYNYAHWLTEIVPKLTLLQDCPEFAGWPVLVDSGLGTNQLETIRAVFPSVQEIIRLPPYDRVLVDELVNVAPTAYCPHEFRDFHETQKTGFQFFFSGWALGRMRQQLRQVYARYTTGRVRRLYLKRTPMWTYNNRNIENIDEIEDLLDARGIELMNVTGMTFAQQAKVFANAELIVAPTGAALANMIFAPAGCRIVVLAAAYDGATYDYFHHIAHLLGHDLSFVVGPQVEDNSYHMNRDYVISVVDLNIALDCVMARCDERPLRTVSS